MSEPAPIPAKVALRLCAAVLRDQATRLRGTASRTARRRPAVAATGQARQAGRDAVADELERDAARLTGWAGDPRTAGAVDAAILGYLLAWLADWGPAGGELRAELEEAGQPPYLPHNRADACRQVITGVQ